MANHWRNANVMSLLEKMGLTRNKTAQLGGRVNPRLLELARARAGVETDSQLIELALGNLVMEDGFSEAFRAARGTISPDLDLES
jgi:hypothetical protein